MLALQLKQISPCGLECTRHCRRIEKKPPLKRPRTGRLNGAPDVKILGQWEGVYPGHRPLPWPTAIRTLGDAANALLSHQRNRQCLGSLVCVLSDLSCIDIDWRVATVTVFLTFPPIPTAVVTSRSIDPYTSSNRSRLYELSGEPAIVPSAENLSGMGRLAAIGKSIGASVFRTRVLSFSDPCIMYPRPDKA